MIAMLILVVAGAVSAVSAFPAWGGSDQLGPADGASLIHLAAAADVAPIAEDESNAFDLHIQIGRFAVLNEQARNAIAFVREKIPVLPQSDDDLYKPETLYRKLYRAVLELNLIILEGCEAGILVDEQCQTLWRDWLKFPGQESYSLAEIQTYADDIQQAEVFIWSALCDAAKKKGADEHFCAVE